MAFIDIFNFKKYFSRPSDAQVARYGHINALYDALLQPEKNYYDVAIKIELDGDTNIIKYSYNPEYFNSRTNIYKYKILAKDEYDELFNSKLQFLTKSKNPIAKENFLK